MRQMDNDSGSSPPDEDEPKLLRLRMPVIPEPSPQIRSVIVPTGEFPEEKAIIEWANPAVEMYCGQCGRVLIRAESVGSIENIVIKCPRCGAYNDSVMTEF